MKKKNDTISLKSLEQTSKYRETFKKWKPKKFVCQKPANFKGTIEEWIDMSNRDKLTFIGVNPGKYIAFSPNPISEERWDEVNKVWVDTTTAYIFKPDELEDFDYPKKIAPFVVRYGTKYNVVLSVDEHQPLAKQMAEAYDAEIISLTTAKELALAEFAKSQPDRLCQ